MFFKKSIFLFATLCLFSCYSKADFVISKDTQNISLNLYTANFLDTYLKDLSSTFSENTNSTIFNEPIIKSFFLTNSNFTLNKINIKGNSMDLDISLKNDISNVYLTKPKDLKLVISKSQDDNTATVSFILDKYKIQNVLNSLPFVDSTVLSYLIPESGNSKLTYKEYEDNLIWIFSDYGPEASLRESVRKSTFDIKVTAQSDIVNCLNCTKLSNNSILFKIPILMLMVSQKPITYSFTYKK